MPSSPDAPSDTDRAWCAYANEMERAARAAVVAATYEQQHNRPPLSMQPIRKRMATLHRQMEQRHQASARLHRLHALHLQRWHAAGSVAARPVFMASVAEDLQLGSAAITLFDKGTRELLSAVSDSRSRSAQEIEETFCEGPARDVANGAEYVLVGDSGLVDRWPQYGRAAIDLRIRSIVAVPLTVGGDRLGALCGYSDRACLDADAVPTARRIADALAHAVVQEARMGPDGITPGGGLLDEADLPSTVNLAAGMVAARRPCTIDAAMALMRARAIAEGISLIEFARRVVDDGLSAAQAVDIPGSVE